MKNIHTENAPQAIGPYTQAKVTGNLLYTSGQIPIDPATGELVSGGIEEQTRRVCENLKAVLEAAGASLESVVKTNCFLKDIGDFAAFNAVYAEYFTGKPARSCVGGLQIPKGALVEVELIAELS
ncbi:MAG: RidA family protein [Oscillospiraceae bacterium]|nr:RidA family protein [Oscillospiraceae bacterium]